MRPDWLAHLARKAEAAMREAPNSDVQVPAKMLAALIQSENDGWKAARSERPSK